MSSGNSLKAFLGSPTQVVITTHHKPDADALGSSLAMQAYLEKLGHSCQVITPSDYPSFLHWMPGHERVIDFTHPKKQEEALRLIRSAGVIFCLDFSRTDRLYDMDPHLIESKARKVLIDHHLDKQDFADFEVYDVKAAATCELIFRIMQRENDLDLLDTEIGSCLYAGIMTDTGSFRHSNTTVEVHLIAAELIKRGVNTTRVHRLIYDNNTEERMHFLGHILRDKLKVLPGYATAYITVSSDELHRYHSQTGDTEGFVNYALSIQGVRMAVVMIDRGDMIKMSFRSVDGVNVNRFAREHFQGGGHQNAAGGKSIQTLEQTEQRLLSLLPGFSELLVR
jgi:phosphoesterase RecJ-like protein